MNTKMQPGQVDKAVMLLSTDWFLCHWGRVGIVLDETRAALIQKSMREIVAQIVNGATEYWLTVFSEDRINRTKDLLRQALSYREIPESAARQILALAEARSFGAGEDPSRWILLSVVRQLCGRSDGEALSRPGPQIEKLICDAYMSIVDYKQRLDEDNLYSKSDWDCYIRNLTPDLPSYLSDFVSVYITSHGEFDGFADFVRKQASPEQKRAVIEWCGIAASELMQESVAFPANTFD